MPQAVLWIHELAYCGLKLLSIWHPRDPRFAIRVISRCFS